MTASRINSTSCMVSCADDTTITELARQKALSTLKPDGLWSIATYFCGVTLICHISHPSTWVFRLSRSITCCTLLEAASEALTCNQRSACMCQGSTANCQLTKDWKECVLGLVLGGFSQQESSGVFLSMGHNGFSSPMKYYSGWQAAPPAT